MFELAIRYFGDDEQVSQWLPLITANKIIGNYGQTEVGHGSNVRVSQIKIKKKIWRKYLEGLLKATSPN